VGGFTDRGFRLPARAWRARRPLALRCAGRAHEVTRCLLTEPPGSRRSGLPRERLLRRASRRPRVLSSELSSPTHVMLTTHTDRNAPGAQLVGHALTTSLRIPSLIGIHSHHRAGFITVCGQLVLQRRGSTADREAVPEGRGYVAVRHHGRGGCGWCLDAAGPGQPAHAREGLSEAEACSLATRHASLVAARELRLAPFTAAYMYTGLPGAQGLEHDRIISPLLYEEQSDTVRIAGTNACAASFPDGSFARAEGSDECAGSDVWPHIRHALAVGFSDRDRRRGDDYCKRRLAWLAGAMWMDHAPYPVRCGVLRLNMSLEPLALAPERVKP
jgi:hypothetical protein